MNVKPNKRSNGIGKEIGKKKKNKYSAKKTAVKGIGTFDSKAEAEYFFIARTYAMAHGLEMRMQEKFELMPKFKLNGKTYRAITYKPDFTFYKGDELVKTVDVKGVQTEVFKMKAKLFCQKYQAPLILAKKTSRGFTEEIF